MYQFKKLDATAFRHWLTLFDETVAELFTGEKAELAKQRERSLAIVMQLKILHSEEGQNFKDLTN